ncbi:MULTISPECIES: SIR2 family protein [Pseudomonas]|uniref:SIR2 family protein n=1 Tax=Pseudomonas TaxID=286 RepID=UPI000DAB90D8|nr:MULTISPECIES: SIR2 family protein [Pseudomonas]MCA5971857.1 SIR2 family protein [Pseudomonas sp. P135]MCH5570193.1 SIR2 family protein [Pseudomonas syringae pv. syringae]
MQLEEAIKHALDGDAVLFVGSGFSFGATSLSGGQPLSGRELAKELYKLAGIDAEDSDLTNASQFYVEKFGEANLTKFCREMFTIRSPAPHHQEIMNLPWQRIYTTNYDDLVERSGVENGKVITALTPSDSPERYLSNSNVCLHINGLISRLGSGDLSGDFKLTFKSYLTDAFKDTPWLRVFRQDLQLARSVVFIGYSMYDWNLAQIVHAEDIQSKTVFITGPGLKSNSPDALRLPHFGALFPIGVGAFSNEVANLRSSYVPSPSSIKFLSLDKVKVEVSTKSPSNADVEKLFLYGDVDEKLVGATSANVLPRCYLLDRDIVADAVKVITEGNDVLITSELGNGKTIVSEQIGRELSSLGWSVYKVSEDTRQARKEAGSLRSRENPVAIIIDGYIPFLEFIDFVSVRRVGRDIKFILTARSHAHEAYLERLENALHVQQVYELDADVLTKKDTKNLVSMIDAYGLWAELSALPDINRMRAIDLECAGQFHQILLRLYEAPQIASRIKVLFESIKPEVRRLAISIFLVKISGLEVQKLLINDLLDNSPLINLSNNDKDSVRFLWSENSGHIRLKSSILAEYFLTSLGDASEVLGVLKGMFLKADGADKTENPDIAKYGYFMRSVMTYSSLQKMLPRNGLPVAVVKFYEDIQQTKFAKKNPHYWLQYAIARMALQGNTLEQVEQYFKSAYEFSRLRPNYNTYQIDNHFARFRLEQAIQSEDVQQAFGMYLDAKAILLKQMLNELKHYPYRVATSVAKVVSIHIDNMSSVQISDVAKFCELVSERIGRLPVAIRTHKYVETCKQQLAIAYDSLASRIN